MGNALMAASGARIERVLAYEALDSRGNPTVACVVTAGGTEAQAIVPSGASTGTHEAPELRDGGRRYRGKGARAAVANVRERLGPAVTGLDADDMEAIDRALARSDGGIRFERLGANAALAVSLASALAGAASAGRPPYFHLARQGDGGETAGPLLPLPMVNVISGGAHAGGAIDIQDLLVVPVGAGSFAEAIEWAGAVRAATADVLRAAGHDPTLVADEGGLAARLRSNREALDVLVDGIARSGLRPGDDVAVAIDVAATQLRARGGRGGYRLASERREVTAAELVDELVSWCDAAPIVSVEDAVADDDPDGWALASEALVDRVQLLGDDLFVTDPGRVAAGIAAGVANSVLVKPNQAGCLSAAAEVVDRAAAARWATVISARSGDTEDSWLADLACAWRCGQIKVGSTTRSERTAKWNRLLRIEAELGGPGVAAYAGAVSLAPLAA